MACLRGGEKSSHKHTGLKAEMGSHLSHNELLGIFPPSFFFPLSVREVSALTAVRTCPAWPKVATKLSRFPQNTLSPPKFLPPSSIQAQDLSHCALICIRNAPCPLAQAKGCSAPSTEEKLYASNSAGEYLRLCSSIVFEEDREIT